MREVEERQIRIERKDTFSPSAPVYSAHVASLASPIYKVEIDAWASSANNAS